MSSILDLAKGVINHFLGSLIERIYESTQIKCKGRITEDWFLDKLNEAQEVLQHEHHIKCEPHTPYRKALDLQDRLSVPVWCADVIPDYIAWQFWAFKAQNRNNPDFKRYQGKSMFYWSLFEDGVKEKLQAVEVA